MRKVILENKVLVLITFFNLISFTTVSPATSFYAEKESNQLGIEKVFYIDEFVNYSGKLSSVFQKNEDKLDANTFHLFSHGKPGELLINGKWLNAQDIVIFLQGKNLSSKIKNLNIYGCEFAKGKKGRAAVQYIQKATGLQVAASTNITGKDGDWLLEIGNQQIKGLESYAYNLQVCTPDYGTIDETIYATSSTGFNSAPHGVSGGANGAPDIISAATDIRANRVANFNTVNAVMGFDASFSEGDEITLYIRRYDASGTFNNPVVMQVSESSAGPWVTVGSAFTPTATASGSYQAVTEVIPAGMNGNYKYVQVAYTGIINSLNYIDAVSVVIKTCITCENNIDAPILDANSISNVCSESTFDLTTISASNAPSGTVLTWHTGTPATNENKIADPSVAQGTGLFFYAAFYRADQDCYSGINGAATAEVSIQGQQGAGCVEICGDDIDNDGDGFTDEYDFDCNGRSNCFVDASPSPLTIEEKYETDALFSPGSTPMAGDIDGDGKPEIVVAKRVNNYSIFKADGSDFNDATDDIIIELRNQDSAANPSVALADVDNDGFGEIIAHSSDGHVYVFEHTGGNATTGVYKARSNDVVGGYEAGNGSPRVSDIDEDGVPEVIVAGVVYKFNADFSQLIKVVSFNANSGVLGARNSGNSNGIPWDSDIVVKDILPAYPGKELIAGSKVWSIDFTTNSRILRVDLSQSTSKNGLTINSASDGPTAVADIDLDGDYDIVYNEMTGTGTGKLVVWDPNQGTNGAVLFGNENGTGGFGNSGGLPTIANIYNDLQDAGHTVDYPEIFYVESGIVEAFNYGYPSGGNVASPEPYRIWKFAHSDQSAVTTLTSFDFNGDGIKEIVYRDQTVLRILNGNVQSNDLPVLATFSPSGSATWGESAIIGDWNSDGEANIAAVSAGASAISGRLTVYGSGENNEWVNARPIWNQRGYNVVNVNDDLTIPSKEQSSLALFPPDETSQYPLLNVYNAQVGDEIFVPLGKVPATDIALSSYELDENTDCPDVSMDLVIENNGSTDFNDTLVLHFYDTDPSLPGATLIHTETVTNATIPLNDSITVNTSFTIPTASEENNKIYLVSNANDQMTVPITDEDFESSNTKECNYQNNISEIMLNCIDPCVEGASIDGMPTDSDSDGDGVNDVCDVDDDNDGVLDITECSEPPTGIVGSLTPLAGADSTNLTDGDKLLSTNAITINGTSYDAVVTIMNKQLPTGSLIIDTAFPFVGQLKLSGVKSNDNPYVEYTITFVESGTATNSNPNGTSVTLQNVFIALPDIDGAAVGNFSDIAGYMPSTNVFDVTAGSSLQSSGFVSGGPSGYTTYTTAYGNEATTTADPNYSLAIGYSSFTTESFVFGVTGTDSDLLNRAFFNTVSAMCDTDNDGIPNTLDLDSDGDGCPDLVEAGVPLTNAEVESAMVTNLDSSTSTNVTVTIVNAQLDTGATVTDTNDNGLNDSVEEDTTATVATVNYTSIYTDNALNINASTCLYDVSLGKKVNNAIIKVGDQVIYTLTVRNESEYKVTGIAVTDVLPDGVTYISDDSSGGFASATGIWTIGDIVSNATKTLNIVARVNQAGSMVNKAEITNMNGTDKDSTPNNGQ